MKEGMMAAFCSSCGRELVPGAKFCPGCGTQVFQATGSAPGSGSGYLLRPRAGRKLAGVCAAFARAYGWDVATVRIVGIILAVVTAPLSEFAYIAAWALIPEEGFQPYVPPYGAQQQSTSSSVQQTVNENAGQQ